MISSSVSRDKSLDDQAQAAVGQLEHLVDVARRADRVQIVLLVGSSTDASRCVKTPMSLPPDIASSMRRTEPRAPPPAA